MKIYIVEFMCFHVVRPFAYNINRPEKINNNLFHLITEYLLQLEIEEEELSTNL